MLGNDSKQREETMALAPIEYLYRPLYRPASNFTVPEGWDYVEAPANEPMIAQRRGLPLSTQPFGIIGYNRRLTREECEHFGLE
jgi:hypothetical protein